MSERHGVNVKILQYIICIPPCARACSTPGADGVFRVAVFARRRPTKSHVSLLCRPGDPCVSHNVIDRRSSSSREIRAAAARRRRRRRYVSRARACCRMLCKQTGRATPTARESNRKRTRIVAVRARSRRTMTQRQPNGILERRRFRERDSHKSRAARVSFDVLPF